MTRKGDPRLATLKKECDVIREVFSLLAMSKMVFGVTRRVLSPLAMSI